MRSRFAAYIFLALAARPSSAVAQGATAAPPPPPLPVWETQVGASFVGTSGNSDTTTLGADFQLHRLWPIWQIESNATAVRTTDRGVRTAERYLGSFRAKRTINRIIGLTTGERAERDQLAGTDFRSILDVGVSYALRREPRWILDGLTSLAWKHENPLFGSSIDNPISVLQLLSRVPFSATADTTQRVTFYPDLRTAAAYRAEAELTVQATMNAHLAMKAGYLWRYSNLPTPGFVKSDNTTTVSLVLRWRATETMPGR